MITQLPTIETTVTLKPRGNPAEFNRKLRQVRTERSSPNDVQQ